MKKKIIIGLSIFTLFFILSGIYLIFTIQKATQELDTLIQLHQVEILRGHLLLQIKKVQYDISLKNTRQAEGIDALVANMRNLEQVANTCFDCHHSAEMTNRLIDMKQHVGEYKEALSEVLTISANSARLDEAEDNVFRIGEYLTEKVQGMITIASGKLETRTLESLNNVSSTKNILFTLIALGPLAVFAFAIFLLRGVTRPVVALQRAAKKLRDGNLDYRITGLEDEFGEVADSFNEMSESLNHYINRIKESENRYRMLFESAGDAIFILDAEGEKTGDIVSANKAAADMHGYTIDELVKLNIKDIDSPEAAAEVPERLRQIMNGEWIKAEIYHRKKDGTIFPVEISAGLLQFMEHKYILAFDRDIAERKRAEEKLYESEQKFKSIFDKAIDGILLADVLTQELYTGNRKICGMLGYSLEELSRLKVSDIHPEEHLSSTIAMFQRQVSGLAPMARNLPVKRKDGSIFYADISASTVTLEGKKYLMGIFRDITDMKKAEELLLQSKHDWEDTFNTLTDMITIHDRNYNIIRANKAARDFLRLPSLESTKVKCYKYYHGKEAPQEDCSCTRTMRTGGASTVEIFEPHLDRFLEMRALPRFDKNKQVSGMIHIIRDVTERKMVEEALQRAEQMRMVGEWAAGLAHEIKNPLAGIKISVEVLAEDIPYSEENSSLITRVIDEIRRIEFLIKNLLDYAKPPAPQFLLTDVNDILDKTISFSLQHPARLSTSVTNIKVIKELTPEIPKIMVDPFQLRQAFLNLLLNSIDALHEGGVLSVKTLYNESMSSVQITISDSGKGMDSEVLSRIFKPFFTTKSKGTGLGLAITKRIIEQNGGTISVDSGPDKGTTFILDLPVKPLLKGRAS